MTSIAVRNLDDGLKRRLRIRAAENGRSMEQEARDILKAALDEDAAQPPIPMRSSQPVAAPPAIPSVRPTARSQR